MTVSSELNRKEYAGNGVTTAFSTSPFVFFDGGDLDVYLIVDATGVATLKTITTHYTVAGGSGSTGTVTMLTAPATGETLVIVRDVPATQGSDFQNNDGSDAEVAEDALDRLTMLAQQNKAAVERSVRLADSDTTGADPTLPMPEAHQILRWDVTGLALEGVDPADIDLALVSPFVETLLDDTTASAFLTTLGFSAFGKTIIDDADASAVLTTLGISAFIKTLIDDTTAAAARTTLGFSTLLSSICQGRLTLTSGVPVTMSDVTAAETLYYTPYKGNAIALYDGSNWNLYSFSELSIDVPDATNCYDAFIYDNSGTPTLELTAWTNPTTRATALTKQDGVLVKTGAVTRRYIGTFYSTTAGNGQIQDAAAFRGLFNYYNREARVLLKLDSSAGWSYATASWRAKNGNTANSVAVVIGVQDQQVEVINHSLAAITAGTAYIGIGFDADTSDVANITGIHEVAASRTPAHARLVGYPGEGLHTYYAVENGSTGGSTFYGTYGSTGAHGLTGRIMA